MSYENIEHLVVKFDESRMDGDFAMKYAMIVAQSSNPISENFNIMSLLILTMLYDPIENDYVENPCLMALWALKNLNSPLSLCNFITELRSQWVDQMLLKGDYDGYSREKPGLDKWIEMVKELGETNE